VISRFCDESAVIACVCVCVLLENRSVSGMEMRQDKINEGADILVQAGRGGFEGCDVRYDI